MPASRTPNIDRTYGHIDLSTGDDAPHRTCKFSLKTRIPNEHDIEVPLDWTFALSFPATIADALTDTDWDFVLRRLDTRIGDNYSPIEMIVASAWALGLPSATVQHKVGRTVAENLYRRFVERQIEVGNSAWVAPSSMQKVSDPNG